MEEPVKKKKADLGAIAFAKVNKLEKRVTELENSWTGRNIIANTGEPEQQKTQLI